MFICETWLSILVVSAISTINLSYLYHIIFLSYYQFSLKQSQRAPVELLGRYYFFPPFTSGSAIWYPQGNFSSLIFIDNIYFVPPKLQLVICFQFLYKFYPEHGYQGGWTQGRVFTPITAIPPSIRQTVKITGITWTMKSTIEHS